jgi:hypothetical protein
MNINVAAAKRGWIYNPSTKALECYVNGQKTFCVQGGQSNTYEALAYVVDGYGYALDTKYVSGTSLRDFGLEVNTDTGSTDLTGDTMVGSIRGKTVIGTSQANASIYAIVAEMNTGTVTFTGGNYGALYASYDMYGTNSMSGATHTGAIFATVWNEATTTVGNGVTEAGIHLVQNTAPTITSGGINAAIIMRGNSWAYGIYAATGSLTKFADVTCTGIGHDESAFKVDATQAAGHNELGIAGYFNANYGGVMTATYLYGFGTWLNLATTFDGAAVYGVVAAQDNGIYASTLTECATTDLIYGMRAECITGASVHGLYAFSLNAPAATTAAHRAIFYADNIESVGHSETERTTKAGSLAIAYINGSGRTAVYYVNLFVA